MITFVSRCAVEERIIEAEVWMLRSAAAPNQKADEPCEEIKTSKRQAGPPVRHDFPSRNGRNFNERSLD